MKSTKPNAFTAPSFYWQIYKIMSNFMVDCLCLADFTEMNKTQIVRYLCGLRRVGVLQIQFQLLLYLTGRQLESAGPPMDGQGPRLPEKLYEAVLFHDKEGKF